jgi:hypothetical protein
MISFALSSDKRVLSIRKRPKETSSKAKIAREPFRDNAIKELSIPVVADYYNHFISAIDEFNHLIAQNASL